MPNVRFWRWDVPAAKVGAIANYCLQRFRYGKHLSHRLTKQVGIWALIDQYSIATPAKITVRYPGAEAPP
jgi:hypothetical protein